MPRPIHYWQNEPNPGVFSAPNCSIVAGCIRHPIATRTSADIFEAKEVANSLNFVEKNASHLNQAGKTYAAATCDVTPKVSILGRGVLAAARKPEPLSVRDWLSKSPQHLTDPRPWVIAPLLADPSNVGALIRNAAALGAGAVITSIAGASPWYRKAIRTSTGSAFRLPVVSSPCLDDDLKWLSEQQNIELVALALTDNAVSIQDFTPNAKKIVLLIGPEDHGLSEFWLDRCHQVVKIPMANGVDSLNAATSAAVALSRLTAIKG